MSEKIHAAIVAVMKEVGAIGKEQHNQSQNYNFRGIDDFYNRVQPLFIRHGVYCTPEVIDQLREVGETSTKKQMHYTVLTVKYTFRAEDGSSVSTTTVGEGADTGDKASSKAMAAAHKYAIAQLLMVPTMLVDPDAHSPEFKRKTADRAQAVRLWGELFPDAKDADDDPDKFAEWVIEHAGREFDVHDAAEWTPEDFRKCNFAYKRAKRSATAMRERESARERVAKSQQELTG